MADQRIAKWTSWVDGAMKREILSMHLRRDTWQQVQELIRANGELPDSYWWQFMFDTYAATQAAAVRRQVYADRDAHSLGRLLTELSDDPGRITQAFWQGLHSDPDDPWTATIAEQEWRANFAGTVGEHLDPAIPAVDLDGLRTESAGVTDWVDRYIAHSDRRPIPADRMATLDDVHHAVERIGEVYNRYYALLTGASWGMLVPAIQHDWKAAFRVPWIKPQAHG